MAHERPWSDFSESETETGNGDGSMPITRLFGTENSSAGQHSQNDGADRSTSTHGSTTSQPSYHTGQASSGSGGDGRDEGDRPQPHHYGTIGDDDDDEINDDEDDNDENDDGDDHHDGSAVKNKDINYLTKEQEASTALNIDSGFISSEQATNENCQIKPWPSSNQATQGSDDKEDEDCDRQLPVEQVHYVSNLMPFRETGAIIDTEKGNMIIKNGTYQRDKDWVITVPIGQKNNSKCYLAKDQTTKQIFVIKRVKKEKHATLELQILINIRMEPGVVKVLGYVQQNDEVYIFMGFISGPTLSQFIQENTVSIYEARILIRQILNIISFLHCHRIHHNDIKSENFIFRNKFPKTGFSSCELVLVGFGLAIDHSILPLGKSCLDCVGVTHNPVEGAFDYTSNNDLSATMEIALEMTYEYFPGGRQPIEYLINQPADNENDNNIIRDFIKAGLQRNGDKRSSAQSLLAHPFMIDEGIHLDSCNMRDAEQDYNPSSTGPKEKPQIPDFRQLLDVCPLQPEEDQESPTENPEILATIDIPVTEL